jgi:hypothetical protein
LMAVGYGSGFRDYIECLLLVPSAGQGHAAIGVLSLMLLFIAACSLLRAAHFLLTTDH